MSELLPIEGTTCVGPIPDEIQKVTMFSAGMTTSARNVDAARRLLRFLSSPGAAPIIEETGMEPRVSAGRP